MVNNKIVQIVFLFLLICSTTVLSMECFDKRRLISLIEASMNGSLLIDNDQGLCNDIVSQEVLSFKLVEIKAMNRAVQNTFKGIQDHVDFEKKMTLFSQNKKLTYSIYNLFGYFTEEDILKIQLKRLYIFTQRFFTLHERKDLIETIRSYRVNNSNYLTNILTDFTHEQIVDALYYWEEVIHEPIKLNDIESCKKLKTCLTELRKFPFKSLHEELSEEYKKIEIRNNATKAVRNPYVVMASGWYK